MGATGIPIGRQLGDTAEKARAREEKRFERYYNSDGRQVLAKTRRGNATWWVLDVPENAERGLTNPFIGVQLWRAFRDELIVKQESEAMGPRVLDCPLKYLDMAPEDNAEWRAEVREHHSKRNEANRRKRAIKRSLEPGCTIKLKEGYSAQGNEELTVHSVTSKRILAKTAVGSVFKILPSQIESVTPPEGEQ